MQSLAAMMHFDFNQPDANSYEQALQTIRRLRLPMTDVDQQFRRTVFNVIARNHDDHVKNIAYLMNKTGEWRLSPAFDVAYSYNPSGAWTSRHRLSVNGKRDDFIVEDLIALALSGGLNAQRRVASSRRSTPWSASGINLEPRPVDEKNTGPNRQRASASQRNEVLICVVTVLCSAGRTHHPHQITCSSSHLMKSATYKGQSVPLSGYHAEKSN